MSQVRLPKEVCDALDHLQSNVLGGHALSKYGVVAYVNEPTAWTEYPELRIVHQHFFVGDAVPDDLVAALANGYIRQLTPEERVSALFSSYNDRYEDYDAGVRLGIKEVLDIYGVKIEGVNTDD